jgi:hypothetical protein
VIDDGSEDGTGDCLAGLDERLRYHWQANRGPAAARNVGIRLARHPVVAFLDADNYWLPDHLETLVAVLTRYPEALLASTCPRFRIGGCEEPEDARLIDALPDALMWNQAGYVSCIAARRDFLLEAGGFDEEMAVGEDDDMWLRLAMKGPFAMVARRTVIRRHTRGGLRDRGRRSGAYTEANTRSLTRAFDQLERRPDAEDGELLARAQARLHVLAAVTALEHRDLDAAQAKLRLASKLMPQLERNAGLILSQIWKSTHDRMELARRAEAAAAAMPDPGCHSALSFRLYAAGLCLTRGRLWRAAQLLFRQPHLLRSGFVSRAARPAARMARDRIAEIIRSSRESPLAR